MGLNVEDIIAGLDPAERCKVEEMAAELAHRRRAVRIRRKDGRSFVLQPEKSEVSPLDVEGGDLGVTGSEIVELIREGRERYG